MAETQGSKIYIFPQLSSLKVFIKILNFKLLFCVLFALFNLQNIIYGCPNISQSGLFFILFTPVLIASTVLVHNIMVVDDNESSYLESTLLLNYSPSSAIFDTILSKSSHIIRLQKSVC
jgi:hypothetical protein